MTLFNPTDWLPCPHCKAKPYRLNEDTMAIEHSPYCPDFTKNRFPATDEAQEDYNDRAILVPQTQIAQQRLIELFTLVCDISRNPDIRQADIDRQIEELARTAAPNFMYREETDFVILPLYENAKPGSFQIFACTQCGWEGHLTLGNQRVCPGCGRHLKHGLRVFTRKELEQEEANADS